MEFQILGSLEAESGGRRVPLGWPCERRVLAALLLDAGQVVPVRQLVDAAWDDPPATAGKQVRNAVSRLRSALGGAGGGDLIVTEPGGYRLAADGCTVDARVFKAGVAAAGQAVADGKLAEAAGLLRSALALWRGPALAGLAGRSLGLAAAAWNERRIAAQEMCYGLELALGRHQEILGELADLTVGNPLREKLAGQYMLALYRCGRQADALAVYRRTRELLADQTGLDPGPKLRELQQQILAADRVLLLPRDAGPVAGHPEGPPSAAADPAGALPAVPPVRYSLPADTAAFTGRAGELDQVTAVVTVAAAADGLVVDAIDGMPGVGKTALAVHAAHMLKDRFPDRQLFIDLHAHTPGHAPMRPQDALAGLLAATGVDPRYLPADLEGRAGMWRDRIAGQRALLVLDNAASSAQVAPLLPGAGCLVLVTSRRHLGDLPGAVTQTPVDVLTPDEAAEMFIRLTQRAAGDRDGVAEVARLAGFLPLAISLLARVFARHPSWTLADLVAETQARLLTLTAEHSSVAAAFEVSYQHLDPASQRFFRLAGMHPGTAADAWAAAALAGTSPDQAAAHLEALHGEGVLTETGYRRYGMHDLIRRYARDLAAADTPGDSPQAVERLLDYYQHTAALAERRLARQTRPGPEPAALAGFEIPDLDDAGRALAWARAERASLLACLDLATSTSQHSRVIALTAGLAAVLSRDGHLSEALTRHAAAAEAARSLGDRLSEANALADLGNVLMMKQDYPGAAQVLEDALGMYRVLGSRLGEANALCWLGNVRCQTGDHPGAAQVLEEAQGIYRELGDQVGHATVVGAFGLSRLHKGDYLGAARFFEQVLCIWRDLGDRLGEAANLHNLGCVRQETGDYRGAAQALEEALGIYRDVGSLAGEANALHELAIVRRRTGDYPGAADVLGQARRIYRDIGCRHGEAHALRELGALRRLTRDHQGAACALDKALDIHREFGDRRSETGTLNEQGILQRDRGDIAQSRDCHQQALELARTIGSPHEEARALAGLGRCALTAGHLAEAGALLRQAQQIYQRIGAAETTDILTDISALTHLETRQ